VRFLIFYFFVAILFVQGSTTTKNIKKSKRELSSVGNQKKSTSRKLSKIASDIQKADKDLIKLDKKLAELAKNQSKNEEEYRTLKDSLKKASSEYEKTSNSLNVKRQEFMDLLTKQFSVVYAIKQFHEPTRDTIITQEVYKTYKKQNARMLNKLKKEIYSLKKKKEDKKYLKNRTLNKIKRIIKKREEYDRQKLAKKKLIKRLAADEEKYKEKLEKIVDKQNSLRSTLAELNILQKKEVEEARKQALARKEAIRKEKARKDRIRKEKAAAIEKERKAKEAIKLAKTKEARSKARLAAKAATKEKRRVYKESEKIRNVNYSYKKPKVYSYNSRKTISPIAGARLVKKFGTYIDPVYKIKIFNESITLQAPSPGAKVKNVLNGKVVFAGKSSMLGKVVVVAHSGKMHTVYAGLSMIAPNIKTGRKIKKGYVVGKVKSKLMFQATKNSKHINPLKLIKI